MKNVKMVFLLFVFLTTIITGCGTPTPSPVPTSIVETIMPPPGITITPTGIDEKECPIDPTDTSLGISTTNITFAIDESASFSKLDKNNRYRITKFLLNIFHGLFQELSVTANYRVDYLRTDEQKMVGPSILSTDTEIVNNIFEGLDIKIKNPSSSQGNFKSHDKYVESFVNERNIATSMGNRVLFYFTDGTFFLNEAGEPNSYTFQVMDDFSQQMDSLSNSPGSSDEVIFFLLTPSEKLKPFARTYWRGIEALEDVDVIWYTPENLESLLRTAITYVLGEENANFPDDMRPAGYDMNSETASELAALEGWRIFTKKNGNGNCGLQLPNLPYNVARESSKISDLTIKYDEGVVESVPWVDDIQNYDDCTTFTIPHPAEELLCKETDGIYFFWWKAEEFTLGLDISNEGNFASICNGVNDPTTGAAVFKVNITKPATIGWDKIQHCFVPQLKFKGFDEVFSTSITDKGNAIFSIDPTLLEGLMGDVEYIVSFKANNCNSQIGESITNVAHFFHYPVSGEKATIGGDNLSINIPMMFYDPSAEYPAYLKFSKTDSSELVCDLTQDFDFSNPDSDNGVITEQSDKFLSIMFIADNKLSRIGCDTMTISWDPVSAPTGYWKFVSESCGRSIIPTTLSYQLVWDQQNKTLISITEIKP